MFIYYVTYLMFMILIYAMVPLLGFNLPFHDGIVKYYAVINIVFLFTVIWWNARKKFYFIWAVYLLFLAGYYGIAYPHLEFMVDGVVMVLSALNIVVTFYDVVVCRCRGIYKRTGKRYSSPSGN